MPLCPSVETNYVIFFKGTLSNYHFHVNLLLATSTNGRIIFVNAFVYQQMDKSGIPKTVDDNMDISPPQDTRKHEVYVTAGSQAIMKQAEHFTRVYQRLLLAAKC